MAKSKVPLILRTSFTTTVSEEPGPESVNIDLSAYVDALSGKVLKIDRVQFFIDDGSGIPLTAADIDSSLGFECATQLATGTQTTLLGAQDDRAIATEFWQFTSATVAPATSASGVGVSTYSAHSPLMGYYVAADNMTFTQQSTTGAADVSVRFMCIIEAERVKLTAADINFLLVNQTQTN
jgi:hypothetical protein